MRRARHAGHAGGGRGLAGWPLLGLLLSVAMLVSPLVLDIASRVAAQAAITSMAAGSVARDDPGLLACLAQAQAYNAALGGYEEPGVDRVLPYTEQLRFGGDEAMAWVEVPKAAIRLPVYHGTSEEVLGSGAGHLEGSSLPVGGATSHCVITAHSGMPTSSAFDEIRRLEEGDEFYVHTLGRTYAYRVYGVEVVLPEEVSTLGLQEGRDLCTLVTCTPYGVNDHRLLVHGERVEVPVEDATVEVTPVEPTALVNVRTVPVVALMVVGAAMAIARRRRRNRGGGPPRHLVRMGDGRARRPRRPVRERSGVACRQMVLAERSVGRHFSPR